MLDRGLLRQSLGGEAFGSERLRRRVRDIRRRGPFFPDLGKQPGLGGGGRPLLLRMIVGETRALMMMERSSATLAQLRRFEHFRAPKWLRLLRPTPKGRHYSGIGGTGPAVIFGGG